VVGGQLHTPAAFYIIIVCMWLFENISGSHIWLQFSAGLPIKEYWWF